ncbi:MAG: hypothetical protein ACI93R_003068 [Flavobacteriales bacterium]|jgi:hypothetical protein
MKIVSTIIVMIVVLYGLSSCGEKDVSIKIEIVNETTALVNGTRVGVDRVLSELTKYIDGEYENLYSIDFSESNKEKADYIELEIKILSEALGVAINKSK